MSANQPFSRNDLQQLKSKTDEQNRLYQINQIVNQIYCNVINRARTQTITSYNYEMHRGSKQFYENNKDDIISGLKTLFPDCSIDYKMLSRGNDGKMYDITNIDEKMRPFINRQYDQAHIVVDWS
jgi:hypothetical protein